MYIFNNQDPIHQDQELPLKYAYVQLTQFLFVALEPKNQLHLYQGVKYI